MNNIQFANSDLGSIDLDKADLLKEKPFTDLTTATGEAIKNSIATNNAITKSIIKGIETGKKTREENIKFFTEFAPKQAGKLYGAWKGIKEDRYWLGQKYDTKKLTEDQGERYELNNAIQGISDETSNIFAAVGDYESANAAKEGRRNRETNTSLLNAYWTAIRPDLYTKIGNIEFEIGGKTYTYAGSEDKPEIRKEIRKRVDIAIASHAYSSGQFSKSEILDGILLKSAKENDKLVVQELAAVAKNNQVQFYNEQNKEFKTKLQNNEPSALTLSINSGTLLIQAQQLEAKKAEVEYTGQSVSDMSMGRVETVLQMEQIGPDAGGISTETAIAALTNSDVPLIWSDGSKHENIIAALDAKFPANGGRGQGILKELNKNIENKWNEKKSANKSKAGLLVNDARTELGKIESDLDWTARVTKLEQDLINQFGSEWQEYVQQKDVDLISNKDTHWFKALEKKQLIEKKYNSVPPAPVSEEEIAALPLIMQDEILTKYKGRVWGIADTFEVENLFKKTLLNSRTYDLVWGTSDKMGYEETNLRAELNSELIGYYNKNRETMNHADALRESMIQLEKNWEKWEPAFDPKHKDHKQKKEDFKLYMLGLAKPGIGYKGKENDEQFKSRIRQTKSFINNVISNNDRDDNLTLFLGEERLAGETDSNVKFLQRWINADGNIPIDTYYKNLSRASGIPVKRLLLYRTMGLQNALKGEDDDLYKDKIKNLRKLIDDEDPISEALQNSNSMNSANLILFNNDVQQNTDYLPSQFTNVAKDFSEKNESLTAYDYIANVDGGNYKHSEPLTSVKLQDISSLGEDQEQSSRTLFGQGKFYNIGAFGIANETEFNRIYSQLYQQGLVKPEQEFNEATQLLFYKQALINKNQKYQWITGTTQTPTDLPDEELAACGLGDQQYPLNKELCDLIHKKYSSKNK
tara:strand:- start:552 stop:3323 length:2772 start_codon:yes stop_codon:yes gene_type:complete